MASSTKPDRRGLVITIIAAAPKNIIRLRSAIDTEAPTADLIWVVSAVSRDTSSPLRAESKKAGESDSRWPKTSRLQIGNDALADRHHQVVARGTGQREHGDDRDHHREVAVDQRDAFRRQAEIDHAPHRDRHQQRGRAQQCVSATKASAARPR